jgi:hypothetical protein
MTTELHLIAAASHDSASHDLADSLSLAQKEALERAVAKIVVLGAQVGVSADQMILLLQSGLTVGELLQVLAARAGDVA